MAKQRESSRDNADATGRRWLAGAYRMNRPFLKTKDFLVTGEEFELVQVSENGLLRTTPVPTNLSMYYQSEGYISHTDRRRTLFEKLYQGIKTLNLKKKSKLLKRLRATPGRLLDIGAGTGDFVLAAQRKGWAAFGVEPNEDARAKGEGKGARVWADIELLPEGMFDIITLWHVLEHLPDPDRVIKTLHGRLANKGHVIVAAPNYRSLDAKHYGPFWAGYDAPRHLWHFTKPSLEDLFKSLGFELIQEKPMWFDAYYVSWLSEKYRNSRFGPIRAFLLASASNFVAAFNGECSSRTYAFRKI